MNWADLSHKNRDIWRVNLGSSVSLGLLVVRKARIWQAQAIIPEEGLPAPKNMAAAQLFTDDCRPLFRYQPVVLNCCLASTKSFYMHPCLLAKQSFLACTKWASVVLQWWFCLNIEDRWMKCVADAAQKRWCGSPAHIIQNTSGWLWGWSAAANHKSLYHEVWKGSFSFSYKKRLDQLVDGFIVFSVLMFTQSLYVCLYDWLDVSLSVWLPDCNIVWFCVCSCVCVPLCRCAHMYA